MRINKLVVNNLGLYKGKNEIDLKPKSKDTPIILFGGMNGAGKTTLFESIRHCFYGKDIFKNITINEYKKYLKSKIYYSEDSLSPSESYISIEFDYVTNGELNTYLIKRYWSISKTDIKEELSIKKDKEFLKIRKDDLQEFLNELIPLGVSNLFFFDGEKIQTIISDNNDTNFVDSFKKLLGINLLESLSSDLKIYRDKQLQKKASDNLKKELERIFNDIAVYEKDIEKENNNLSILKNKSPKIKSKIDDYKKKMNSYGGIFWENKKRIEEEQINLKKLIKDIELELKDISINNLLILISRKVTQKLVIKLNEDRVIEGNTNIINFINDRKKIFFSKLNLLEDANIVKTYFEEIFNLNNSNNEKTIGLSKTELNNLLEDISFSDKFIRKKILNLLSKYKEYYDKLLENNIELEKVPEDKMIKPLYDTINKLKNEEKDILKKEGIIEYKIEKINKDIKNLENEKDKIEKNIEIIEKNNIKIDLIGKTQLVLKKYKEYLVNIRIDELEELFLEIFNNLHRKEIVTEVKIDKINFNIELFDKTNNLINKELLSSGEKEIYAISLLQSLSKISKLRLPFIIDTPLGRLDTTHRVNIIEDFMTKASHQVIIFSTNTEIDENYYNLLKPYISREYILEFDLDKKFSKVKEGYFW